MVQVKKYSEADLVDFYVGSPVFKKYSQYHFLVFFQNNFFFVNGDFYKGVEVFVSKVFA